MSFFFLLPVEIPLAFLQVAVLATCVKLGLRNSKLKAFFFLYSLQNSSELLAYAASFVLSRLMQIGLIPPTFLNDTVGAIIEKSMYFTGHCQQAAHVTVVLERTLAIVDPTRHKRIRQGTGIILLVAFACGMSSIILLLSFLDETMFVKTPDALKIVPKHAWIHSLKIGYGAFFGVVYAVVCIALEWYAFTKHRQQKPKEKAKGKENIQLIGFCMLHTAVNVLVQIVFVSGFSHYLITGDQVYYNVVLKILSYTPGISYLNSSLFLVIKSKTVRNALTWLCFITKSHVHPVPTSSEPRTAATILFSVKSGVFGFAILLNASVCRLIYRHKAPTMQSYARLLLISTAVDLCQSVLIFVAQPITIIDAGMSVTFFNGFTTRLPESVNWVLFTLTFFFFNAVFACSEVQFLCRYLLLCKEYEVNVVLRRVAGPIAVILLFMAAQFAWEMKASPEKTPQLLDVLRKFGWSFNERPPPPVFGCLYSDPIAMVGAALASMHFNLGYVLILFCEFKVYRFIRRNRNIAFTLNTRTHRDVHKALVIMALTPLAATVLPLTLHVIFASIRKSPKVALAILTELAGLGLIINPITTVVFIRPYRAAVIRALREHLMSSAALSPANNAGVFNVARISTTELT